VSEQTTETMSECVPSPSGEVGPGSSRAESEAKKEDAPLGVGVNNTTRRSEILKQGGGDASLDVAADSTTRRRKIRRQGREGDRREAISSLLTSVSSIEHDAGPLIIVRGTLDGRPCNDILIDTGAASSFVSQAWALGQGLRVQRLTTPLVVTLADGEKKGTMTGAVRVQGLTTQGSTAPCTLIVMEQLTHHVILGMPWLRAARVSLDLGQVMRWNGRRMFDTVAARQSSASMSSSTSRPQSLLCAVKVGTEHETRMAQILRMYPAAFSTDLPKRSVAQLAKAIQCKVTLKDAQCRPVISKERRRSPADRQTLIDSVKEMEKAGLIRPSRSPWSSQPVLVKKVRDGVELQEKRPCWDYRRVNDLIMTDAHPLPLPENMFDELVGCRLFSKMDLTKGFWQIPMEEGSKAMLAMATPLGLYEPNFMPFGMKNAPAVFQREMQRVLKDRLGRGVMVFIDDILIFSATVEEHEQLVQWVLRRLQEEGYYAHPDKCEFFQREVSFLGHMVSERGVAVQQHKVKSIQGWPALTTRTEVRSFLGMTGYYRKFIEKYSEMALPLTRLTQEDVRFTWGEAEQTAFDRLKEKLSSAEVLAHPDPQRQYIVHTDASEFAIAGVLSQEQKDGSVRPVAYYSRKMSGAETRYSSIYEKELLALVRAVEQWRCYLEGNVHPVLLLTDHKGLTWLNSTAELSGRQARWVEKLAELEYKVTHVAGADNVVADALSRRGDYEGPPVTEVAVEEQDVRRGDDGPVDARHAPAQRTRIALRAAAVTMNEDHDDDESSRVRTKVKGLPSDDLVPLMKAMREAAEQDPWYAEKLRVAKPDDGLLREDGLLRTANGLWYVPDDTDLKRRILHEVHDAPGGGHTGVEKTMKKLQRQCWWSGMREEVAGYVGDCKACQSVKHSQRKPAGLLRPLPTPSRPYEVVTMDFMGPLPKSGEFAYDYVLVVVDKFSKRVHFIPCHKTVDAPGTAMLLLDHVVKDRGLPESIVCDRDPRWTGEVWSQLFAALGTKMKRSSSYHPQTDGQTERVNRSLEAGLRAYVNKRGTDWSKYLSMVEASINSSVHESTGKTPFELTGVDWRDPLSFAMQSASGASMSSDVAQEVLDGITTAWEDARRMMLLSKERMKRNADRRRRDEQYAVGDAVMLSTRNMRKLGHKLDPLWVGPFEVTEVSESGLNVTLDLPAEYARLHQPFHVEKVKRFMHDPQWVGRQQEDRPRPELIDGHREYEVERIVGKKEEVKVRVVYDDGGEDGQAEAGSADSEEKEERKEERKEEATGSGAWGSRLRSRPSSSAAVPVKAKSRGRLKKRKGKKEEVPVTMYKVKWMGYGDEEATWETVDNLTHSQDAIDEYERTHPPSSSGQWAGDSVALQYLHAWAVCWPGEAELRTVLVCG
jgi:hypothetical protein